LIKHFIKAGFLEDIRSVLETAYQKAKSSEVDIEFSRSNSSFRTTSQTRVGSRAWLKIEEDLQALGKESRRFGNK